MTDKNTNWEKGFLKNPLRMRKVSPRTQSSKIDLNLRTWKYLIRLWRKILFRAKYRLIRRVLVLYKVVNSSFHSHKKQSFTLKRLVHAKFMVAGWYQ